MAPLSDQEIEIGTAPWTEPQTLSELHLLSTDVLLLFNSGSHTVSNCHVCFFFFHLWQSLNLSCLSWPWPFWRVPLFYRMSLIWGWPDVFSWLDWNYAVFGKNTTEVILCLSQCSISGVPVGMSHWWCWITGDDLVSSLKVRILFLCG